METIKYIYYQDGDTFVGWLEEYPDYRTQGTGLNDLEEHLMDIYKDIASGQIPHIRKRGELVIT